MSGFPTRTVMFVSLALNLLIIGAGVGAYYAGLRLERPVQGTQVERMPGPRAFMAALPVATRDKIREGFIQGLAQTRPLRMTARQTRIDAFEAARAEPYDVERVRTAFGRMRVADAAVTASFQDQIARSLGEMTPEERHTALEALRTAQPMPRDPNNIGVSPFNGPVEDRPHPFRDRARQRTQQRQQH